MEKRKLHRLLAAAGMTAMASASLPAGAAYFDMPASFKLDGVDAERHVVADFNADGIDDVAAFFPVVDPLTGARSSRVNFLVGNAAGAMKIETSLTLPIATADVVTGDFNGDGQTDLAVSVQKAQGSSDPYCGTSDGVAVFFGFHNEVQPDLQFANCLLPSAAGALSAFDANGDGLDDLVVGDRLYLGQGGAVFNETATLPSGNRLISDIDGDRVADVMTDNAAACGLGDGSYRSCLPVANDALVPVNAAGKMVRRVIPAYGTTAYGQLDAVMPRSAMAKADVNGDGIDDLVGWAVTSMATPAWDEWYTCPIGAVAPAGTVFAANSAYTIRSNQRNASIAAYKQKYVNVFNGLGGGYYVLRSLYNARNGQVSRADSVPLSQVRADWNAAYGSTAGGSRVVITRPFRKARGGSRQGIRAYGSGYVTRANRPTCRRYLTNPTWLNSSVDVGFRHVVATDESYPQTVALRVILMNADGSQQQVISTDIPDRYIRRIAVSDVDGDGIVDVLADLAEFDLPASAGKAALVFAAGSDTMSLLKGNGDGTFAAPVQTGLAVTATTRGDFNGDGMDDFGQIALVAGSENVFTATLHLAPASTPVRTLPATVPAPVVVAPAPVVTPPPVVKPTQPATPTQATPTSKIESSGQVSEAGQGYFIVNGTRITVDASSSLNFQDGFGPAIKAGDAVQFTGQAYSDGSVVLIAAEIG